jgi:hypothetical protein
MVYDNIAADALGSIISPQAGSKNKALFYDCSQVQIHRAICPPLIQVVVHGLVTAIRHCELNLPHHRNQNR